VSYQTGDHQQAQWHLAIATDMYRDMDMGFWLAKANAELQGST
jgi:hypothetical protein